MSAKIFDRIVPVVCLLICVVIFVLFLAYTIGEIMWEGWPAFLGRD